MNAKALKLGIVVVGLLALLVTGAVDTITPSGDSVIINGRLNVTDDIIQGDPSGGFMNISGDAAFIGMSNGDNVTFQGVADYATVCLTGCGGGSSVAWVDNDDVLSLNNSVANVVNVSGNISINEYLHATNTGGNGHYFLYKPEVPGAFVRYSIDPDFTQTRLLPSDGSTNVFLTAFNGSYGDSRAGNGELRSDGRLGLVSHGDTTDYVYGQTINNKPGFNVSGYPYLMIGDWGLTLYGGSPDQVLAMVDAENSTWIDRNDFEEITIDDTYLGNDSGTTYFWLNVSNRRIRITAEQVQLAATEGYVGLYADRDSYAGGVLLENTSGINSFRPTYDIQADLGKSGGRWKNGWIQNAWTVGDMFYWKDQTYLIREKEDGWLKEQRIPWATLVTYGLVYYNNTQDRYNLFDETTIEDIQAFMDNNSALIEEAGTAKDKPELDALLLENAILEAEHHALIEVIKEEGLIANLEEKILNKKNKLKV